MKEIEIVEIAHVDELSLCIKVRIDNKSDAINVSFSDNLKDYITVDRIDPIVMGLMVFAIRNGYDFKSTIPITDELAYKLKHHYIEALCNKYHHHKPRIQAPVTGRVNKVAEIVSTGISCGVDSLYTIASNMTDVPENYKITHLTYLNHGGSKISDSNSSKKLALERYELARDFCNEYGFPLIEITTDLPEFIERHGGPYAHSDHHTHMMLFCMMLIQKGLRHYYYSSGYGYDGFDCNLPPMPPHDGSHYDLLTLMCASNEDTLFESFGSTKTRKEKLEKLSDYEPAHNYLNVCVNTLKNDCTCFKCIRTIFELESLGVLDKFSKVFDPEIIQAKRSMMLAHLYRSCVEGDLFMQELYPHFKDQIKITTKLKVRTQLLKERILNS